MRTVINTISTLVLLLALPVAEALAQNKQNMEICKDVMVPMRDGVKLATDIYFPKMENTAPTLLARTPYNKNYGHEEIERFVEAGYIVIMQDVRGRFASEGTFDPFAQETNDGLDMYDWITAQPWSNGIIGIFGESYLGGTQWIPARKSPKAVKAMIPQVTFSDTYNTNIYNNGVKVLHDLRWLAQNIVPATIDRLRSQGQKVPRREEYPDVDSVLNQVPLASHPILKEYGGFYQEWIKNPTAGPYWDRMSHANYRDSIVIPALNISGWYDIFCDATFKSYLGMKAEGGSATARNGQKIIMGPWTHMNLTGKFHEIDFGPESSQDAIDLTGIKTRWFDHWLKGIDNGIEKEDPVMYFTMGENKWHTSKHWPLESTHFTRYYLHSSGCANSSSGDGSLSTTRPVNEPTDTYLYDPNNPTPTVGGQVILPGINSMGPRDQGEMEKRNDVLVFSTSPIEKPVEVTGPVEVTLFASSDCLDTDFAAKLVDVYPDGRAMILSAGIIRARYRNSYYTEELLTPGKTYEYVIQLPPTSNLFRAGHRIRLEIASCNFPQYARNSNTGGNMSIETISDYKTATNTICHSQEYPSSVLLPIIER